jgi:hypothetical protein
MSKRTKIIFIISIVLLAAASRLVKHQFNFTPVAAMAIFAGAYLKNWKGLFIPLFAMVVSDYFIGFYDWQVMGSVYVGIAIAYLMGYLISNKKKWYTVLGAGLASSIAFFIVTNFAVWAFFSWYPHTVAGLVNCFTLALPFFRNTLMGDLVYTGAFFGVYEGVVYLVDNRTRKAITEDSNLSV